MTYPTGLIVGRFDPPHLGHSYMIESAAARCEQLVVFVNSSPVRDTAPGHLRAGWLADLHPDVTVIEVRHALATNFDDPDLWTEWMELFRAHWPRRRRAPRRVLVGRLRRRAGRPLRCRRGGRRRGPRDGADQRDPDPYVAGRASRPARSAGPGLGRVELALSVARENERWSRPRAGATPAPPTERFECGADYLFGCLVTRRYGLISSQPLGNRALASSLETAGTMMTFSPSFQLAGVATL